MRSVKHKAVVKVVKAKIEKRILAETVMRWKIFKLQTGTQKISEMTADDHYRTCLKLKIITALQAYQTRQ